VIEMKKRRPTLEKNFIEVKVEVPDSYFTKVIPKATIILPDVDLSEVEVNVSVVDAYESLTGGLMEDARVKGKLEKNTLPKDALDL
jgi:hypothetical protein